MNMLRLLAFIVVNLDTKVLDVNKRGKHLENMVPKEIIILVSSIINKKWKQRRLTFNTRC